MSTQHQCWQQIKKNITEELKFSWNFQNKWCFQGINRTSQATNTAYDFLYITVNLKLTRMCLFLTMNNLLLSVERVFKFVGSVPQGDETKRKYLLVSIVLTQEIRRLESCRICKVAFKNLFPENCWKSLPWKLHWVNFVCYSVL